MIGLYSASDSRLQAQRLGKVLSQRNQIGSPIKNMNSYHMHNPPHPGEILKKLCLEPLGLSVTKAAKALDVSRSALSNLLNGHTGITPEMAMRLSIAFDTTAESWMNQQVQYDLWKASQRRRKFHVTRLSNGERAAA